MLLKKKWLLAIMILLCCTSSKSQTNYRKVNYEKHPVWIQMMNDTSVNYFETVKAFREYFKDRVLPKEANELEGSDSFEKEVGLTEEDDAKSEKEREHEARKVTTKEPDYAAEVRAFKGWFYGIQPWVRSDGTIVGPKEQQAIIDKQHNELRETENANGKH